MFTPDNFYYVFRENYIDHTHMMWTAANHGDKDLAKFEPFVLGDTRRLMLHTQDLVRRAGINNVYMYDQEPLFASADLTYRAIVQDYTDLEHLKEIDSIDLAQLLSINHPCLDWPIWCHSEWRSQEVDRLRQSGYVTCYYWYHAFIAREWFRHWQRNRSLAVEDKSSRPFRFLLYTRDFSGTRVYREQILRALDHLRPVMHANWQRDQHLGSHLSAVIDTEHAQSAAIHLVAETLFDHSKLYLTEKVFKPMVMSQPFIVWGPAGTLALLRHYGFKTFDHVWSEAYDDETDAAARMQALVNLVNDIADMSAGDFKEMYARTLPIVQHNRDWFYSQQFMDLCWRELEDNWQTAQQIRTSLKIQKPWGQTCHMAGHSPALFLTNRQSGIKKLIRSLPDHVRAELIRQFGHLASV